MGNSLRDMLLSSKGIKAIGIKKMAREFVSNDKKWEALDNSVPYYKVPSIERVLFAIETQDKIGEDGTGIGKLSPSDDIFSIAYSPYQLTQKSIAVCQSENFLCAEYRVSDDIVHCAILNKSTKEIKKAFAYNLKDESITPYSFFTGEMLGEALILASISLHRELIEEKLPFLEAEETPEIIEDIILNDNGLDVGVPPSGNFPTIIKSQIEQFICDEIVIGEPLVFCHKRSDKVSSFEELLKNEAIKLADGTDPLVPKLTAAYQVPSWMPRLLRKTVRFIGTDDSAGNMFMYGPSGSGKTLGCRAMAQAMGLPYYTHVFSSDSDLYNSTVQVIPQTGQTADLSYDDIRYSPEDAYKTLTGEVVSGITSEEVFEAYTKQGGGYVTVPSTIVEAIQKPSLLELQEVFTAPPAVVTFLNSLLDGSRTIRLMTGETIARDPKSIICVTTNVGYAGYRESTESFLDRFTPIKIDTPTDDELKARLVANTGITNKSTLWWLCEVRNKTAEWVEENGITQATYGYRMLEKVVRDMQFRIEDGDDVVTATREAAIDIIPFHISRNDDEQREFIDAVLTPEILKLKPKGGKM